jgi:hypothetical protein
MTAASAIPALVASTDIDLNSLLRVLLTNVKHAIAFSEYVYLTNGVFRSATERTAKYFITNITFQELDSDQDDNIKEILEDQLDIKSLAANMLVDLLVYGNSFTFIYFPFIRTLQCGNPRCGSIYNIEKINYELEVNSFTARCPRCGYHGPFKRQEENLRDPTKIHVQRLDPKYVEIDYDPISGQTEYYMLIDTMLKQKISNRDKHIIDKIPWVFFEASEKDRMVKFAPGQIFHLRAPGIAGLYHGWGTPQAVGLTEYLVKSHYYTKAELAILKDFIVPKRVLYPANNEGGFEFFSTSVFKDRMAQMQEEHKKDPTKIMLSPFPIGYQAIGGEGKALNLSQEEEYNTKQQLAAAGFPADLYFMTFQMQVLPASLRLFQNIWSHIPAGLNKWIKWIVERISSFMQIEPPDVKWQEVTIADDLERRHVLLQLASAQQVSLATALEPLGINIKDELKKLMSQATMQQEVIEEAAEEQRIKTQLTGGGAGPGGGGPMDADATMAQAQEIAQQWLYMEETQRHQMMRQLKQQNQLLHGVAMSLYEDMAASVRQQGGAEQLAAMRQQGGTGQQPPGQQMM